MSNVNSSKELDELTNLLQNQNKMIEALEKELNELTLKSKVQADDPNAQQVKKLQTENDKLKYRIRILNQSIAEVNGSSSVSSSSNSSSVAATTTTIEASIVLNSSINL